MWLELVKEMNSCHRFSGRAFTYSVTLAMNDFSWVDFSYLCVRRKPPFMVDRSVRSFSSVVSGSGMSTSIFLVRTSCRVMNSS